MSRGRIKYPESHPPNQQQICSNGNHLNDTLVEPTAEEYYVAVTGRTPSTWSAASFLDTDSKSQDKCSNVVAALPSNETCSGSVLSSYEDRNLLSSSEDYNGHIGYKLLKKAGWKGSGGLGAREQGIASPITAWHQSGRQGVGTTLGNSEGPASSEQRAASNERQQNDKARTLEPIKKSWQRVMVEESTEDKVKRWNQVLKAEAEDEANKAIDRYIFRAFRDEGKMDTNPLTRRNNLSSSNPLL